MAWTPDGGEPGAAEPERPFDSEYGVIVICQNEAEQKQVYESLTEGGYTCKVVVT
jgi:hypothetical protein